MTSGYFNFLFALIYSITKGPGITDELKKLENFFFLNFLFIFFLLVYLILQRIINEIHRIINEIHRFINEIHRLKPKPTSVASEKAVGI